MTDRGDAALERIATALEQIALEQMPAGLPTGEPPLPTPPPELVQVSGPAQFNQPPVMQPLPPLAAPFQFTGPAPAAVEGPRWSAGMNHTAGHKPLKENNRGLYCPTKLQDGTWCQFTVKAG